MLGPFLFLLLLQLVIPAVTLIGFWRRHDWTRRDLAISLLLNGSFLAFLFVVAPWGLVPYYLRYLWPLLLIAGAVRAWVLLRRAEVAGTERKHRLSAVACVLVAGLLLYRTAPVIPAMRYPAPALELEFPLREGVYLVGHGGNHETLNYHNVHPPQRFALDIVALNWAGAKAWGLGPKQLDRYAVWGHTLYSPSDGTIRNVVSDQPDHIPPASSAEGPAGNYVEIETGEYRVYLAHMQRGSARVKKGDRVTRGQPLGKVGNSGNTSEPHLHLHAVRGGSKLEDGEGVPVTFNGRFLLRNDVVWGG